MNRRRFIKALSCLPFLGFLKLDKAEAKENKVPEYLSGEYLVEVKEKTKEDIIKKIEQLIDEIKLAGCEPYEVELNHTALRVLEYGQPLNEHLTGILGLPISVCHEYPLGVSCHVRVLFKAKGFYTGGVVNINKSLLGGESGEAIYPIKRNPENGKLSLDNINVKHVIINESPNISNLQEKEIMKILKRGQQNRR